MPSGAERLLQRAKALEKATGPGGPLAALEEYFGLAEATVKAEFIIKRVAKRAELIALVRSILESGWDRSGLNKNSSTGHGQLYRAAVKDAIIEATSKGIVIRIPPGLGKQLYAWAGAMLYGAVHGPVEKHEIRDTVTGKLNESKSAVAKSVLGHAAKRSIKRAAFKGVELSDRARNRIQNASTAKGHTQRRGVNLGEVHVRAPHKFWNFSNAEYDAVGTLWVQLLMQEVSDVLIKHRAMTAKIANLAS